MEIGDGTGEDVSDDDNRQSTKTKYLYAFIISSTFHAAAINCMRFPLKSPTTMVQTNRRQKEMAKEESRRKHRSNSYACATLLFAVTLEMQPLF